MQSLTFIMTFIIKTIHSRLWQQYPIKSPKKVSKYKGVLSQIYWRERNKNKFSMTVTLVRKTNTIDRKSLNNTSHSKFPPNTYHLSLWYIKPQKIYPVFQEKQKKSKWMSIRYYYRDNNRDNNRDNYRDNNNKGRPLKSGQHNYSSQLGWNQPCLRRRKPSF